VVAIDAQLVSALVAAQFPRWASLPVVAVGRQGNDNRTFRLGDELTVRLPSAAPYAAGIAKEDRALPLLSAHVGVDLPDVVAAGEPSDAFPLPWSVRRWQDGQVLSDAAADLDRGRFAEDLAAFLLQLRAAPAQDGPACGRHCFYRGCHPSVYADEVQQALSQLGGAVDGDRCRAVWRDALATAWPAEPVWFHGDVAEGNLLVRGGSLGAVIDFGTCGVGDPACDLVIAWTFMGAERERFRARAGLDAGTWARARGWALWKALITLTEPGGPMYAVQERALANLLADPG
jgi:aminoglycoside phosphotransferase (APT) family kinase protein